jgi:hypothetical protein
MANIHFFQLIFLLDFDRMMKYGRTENLIGVVTKYAIWDFADWVK